MTFIGTQNRSFEGSSITGTTGITMNGTGVVELTAVNTFTGDVAINTGTLVSGAAGALGAGQTTVAAGAALGLGYADALGDLERVTFSAASSILLMEGITYTDTLTDRLATDIILALRSGAATIGADSAIYERVTEGYTVNVSSGATLTDHARLALTGETTSITGGGTYQVHSLVLSADGSTNTTLEIAAGTTLHILSTVTTANTSSAAGSNFSDVGGFMLSEYPATGNVVTVAGTLILECGISNRDGSGTLTVQDGGNLVLKQGLEGTQRSAVLPTVNIETGATLTLSSEAADDDDSNALVVNIRDGATISAADAMTHVYTTMNFANEASDIINLDIQADKTLQLHRDITLASTANIAGTGTLQLSGSTSLANLTAAGASLRASSDSTTLGSASGLANVYVNGAATDALTVTGTLSYDVSSGKIAQLVAFSAGSSIDGEIILDAAMDKYFSNVRYDDILNMIIADVNTDFYTSKAVTANGHAGYAALTELALSVNPQTNSNAYPDLAAAMNALDTLLTSDKAGADRLAAAMVGASSASLGVAQSEDMSRQLRSIRNRSLKLGDRSDFSHGETVAVSGWINAEGNNGSLSAEGTDAGYDLSSWGGTVGVEYNADEQTTLGIALTAMYGDLSSTDVDHYEGDLNTQYSIVFAAGFSDISGTRTVNYGAESYHAHSSTDGYSVGVLYELARTYYIDKDAEQLWQPIINLAFQSSHLDGYTERGSDAALRIDEQTMSYATLGLGARYESNFGETIYNRCATFSARAMAKLDIGDNRSELQSAFDANTRASGMIRSAERGQFGAEVALGLVIPITEGTDSIFLDASLEVRQNYSNVNATAGYRYSF